MEQRTEQWHAARAGRITASTAGAFLGLSPFIKPEDAMRALVRSMHGMPSEFSGNVATEYGTFHEAGALVEYQMETGNTVESCEPAKVGNWLASARLLRVSDDGIVRIYCPFGKRDAGPFVSVNSMPAQIAKMQIDMLCSRASWCDFYQWAAHGTKLQRVYMDHDWAKLNLGSLKDAWEDAQYANPKHYVGPRRVTIDTPKSSRMVKEFLQLSEAIERAVERRNELVLSMGMEAKGRNSIFSGHMLTLEENGWVLE